MPLHDTLLIQAFPSLLTKDAEGLLSIMDFQAQFPPLGSIAVMLRSEQIQIPERVYFDLDLETPHPDLSTVQRTMYACLYTRHDNGYMRKDALRITLQSNAYWVAPFVVQLASEYVEEILLVIYHQLPDLNKAVYRSFLKANPRYYQRTKQRMISYWNCYYRWKQPRLAEYVGAHIFAYFDALLEQHEAGDLVGQ